MKKIFKTILIYLSLINLSIAGTIINATIDNGNNSKTYIGIGKNNSKGGGGDIINNEGTIINSTIDSSNNSKTYIGIGKNNSKGGGGKIYIKDGYIDTKKCYQKLNIPYDEKKVKITILDNQNIKINNKTIKINECLIKNK